MIRQGCKMVSMLLMIVVVLGACGGSEPGSGSGAKVASNTDASQAKEEAANPDRDHATGVKDAQGDDHGKSANDLDNKRKAEPRRVPTEFPLPTLEGWVEGSPFEALTTGKKEGWSAEFFYEDALEENVKKYEQLLLEHGYQVDAKAMVAMSLGAGYIVSGHISGILYSGTVVFDTNADGQQRVWMTFTEKIEN